ncbi:MAG TPA: T9SS type A sorting domain-containing protein, partial [Bacteroidia bacterium]|nr:T9SS type A sorting domain-containing protein [Bacteroidia bacterium]
FWIIDGMNYSNPNYYSTPPAATITFSFTDGSMYTEIGTNNTITEANLEAQRWNSTSNTWGDWIGAATIAAGGASHVGTASAVTVTSANMFRAWTLVDNSQPLPIELVSFTVECNNYVAMLKWTTATETNNDYFTLERTQDGINYEAIATVKGAGNSSTPLNYTAIDESPLAGISYYRISQTDFDGIETHLNTIVYQPCEDEESINAFTVNNNTIAVQINSKSNGVYSLTLMNTLGQRIMTETKSVTMGMNDYSLNPQVVHGIYIIQVTGKDKVYSKKLYLGSL